MRIKERSLRVAILVLTLHTSTAIADGGFVGRSLSIWEPAQAACILWDEDAGRQELILQVAYEFYGVPEEFAWIVPLPGPPTLGAVTETPFPAFYELTKLRTRKRRVECLTTSQVMSDAMAPTDVEVIAEETVGIYETLVIAASDAGALLDSLSSWGFLHSENEQFVEETLQFYVDKSWYFVAMRTDSIPGDPGEHGHHRGVLDPIRLSFDTDEPVYPMRISQLSSMSRSKVDLFVVAAHRMECEGLTALYANAINAGELRAIRHRYPALASLIGEGDFVTRLSGSVPYGDMADDFSLHRALVDDEYLRIRYSGWPLAESLGLLALLGLGLRGLRRPRPRTSN